MDVEHLSRRARKTTRFAHWAFVMFAVGWTLLVLCDLAERTGLIGDLWESALRLVVWCVVVCLLIYVASRSSLERRAMAALIVFAVCSVMEFSLGVTADVDSLDHVLLVGRHGAMNHMFGKLLWGGWACSIAYLFSILVRSLGQSLRALHEEILEHKRTEEALRESHRRLEETLDELQATQEQLIQQERLRALGEMASGVAHDLNNTLTPVLGYSDVLVNSSGLPGDVQERLELIRTGALDAARVVARLREFYRPSDPADEGETLQLATVLREVVELTRPKWRDEPQREGRDIEVDLRLEDVPPVVGVNVQIREVLTNLVFNAVDALSHGGKITLRLRGTPGGALIEVADVGVGMPADVQARCLEPFFTTKGNRGTGLGLSVCHGIIQRHGGGIRVESSPGQGTTISVSLPAAEDDDSVEEAAANNSLPASRVLYIDDDPDVRASVRFMLETLGQEVDVAQSGTRGLEMLAADDYDLVVTDLGMPEMDGYAVTRRIKATQPDLPVVMITGWGSTSAPEPSRPGEGPDHVLGKPHTLERLREVLARVLRP